MPLCNHPAGCSGVQSDITKMTDSPRPSVRHVYRYRSAEAVLGKVYEELEKQEIYFSRTDELNDPMEGFKDLFWKGDEIVWRALLKHYAFVTGPNSTKHSWRNLSSGRPRACLPLSEKSPAPTSNIFSRQLAIKAFLAAVVSRECPVRRNELAGYLRALHPPIMTSIFNDLRMRGLSPVRTAARKHPGAAPCSCDKTHRNCGKSLQRPRRCRKGFGCAVLGGGSSI